MPSSVVTLTSSVFVMPECRTDALERGLVTGQSPFLSGRPYQKRKRPEAVTPQAIFNATLFLNPWTDYVRPRGGEWPVRATRQIASHPIRTIR
jgi:hypothetical protein